jgi:hypothetical protein
VKCDHSTLTSDMNGGTQPEAVRLYLQRGAMLQKSRDFLHERRLSRTWPNDLRNTEA